jgi:hypothetical protein
VDAEGAILQLGLDSRFNGSEKNQAAFGSFDPIIGARR